ncbi:MAG: hypothetical protein GY740_10490, partial [Gammaproteobacteria bacterium]|nr:hypothetical protein [Gammaproteobacteria bacterium]
GDFFGCCFCVPQKPIVMNAVDGASQQQPELVLLVPQRVIESIGGGDDGQLRVRLDQVERAERLLRDLRNLLSRDSVRSLSAEDWAAAIRRLLDGQKEEETTTAPMKEGRDNDPPAQIKEVSPTPPPPPPPPAGEGGRQTQQPTADGWRHLDRCKILAPQFLG